MPFVDDQGHVLVLSGLWNVAMTQPDDPEFPSLGIFKCMASLIQRGLTDKDWLLRDQNIYIPYYAAHIIGSYTMKRSEFAEKAVESSVIPPLMELLRGKMSWVEQRVAVRALGHLASYESTFIPLAAYEQELVNLAMDLASTCIEVVYVKFVEVKDKSERLNYHCDLLTRGIGGVDMENKKAEEWASQLQCWSLYLLNCFAVKERSIGLMCKNEFLKDLCEMWGGLVNHTSPCGVGLIRILCYSEIGRKKIAESQEVIEKLCNLSRSTDDWQYMGIDCLQLLLNDPNTRHKVIEIASSCLADLVEIRKLGGKTNVGESIARTLLLDFKQIKKAKIKDDRIKRALEEMWDLKVERRRKERNLSTEKFEERRVLVRLIKQEGNERFWVGKIEEASLKYTEGLEVCPLKLRKERIVLYSNRAQCCLLLNEPDKAISDTTRALSLSNPVNSHGKSLWRRSQAYDMKGLAKESLMDCLMFIKVCFRSKQEKIPYYAARMITKQMDSTWLFATARSKTSNGRGDEVQQSEGGDERSDCEMMRMMTENKGFLSGLATIIEEPLIRKCGSGRRKVERARER
ncbi:ARM-repeat/Tetratricopeptide repeat (TPR)-like protein [Actinidia rufa]|uniref:ARM-repeat/Tetratricopeptide repeat (TPR)-like protein n=1 Tax=Actinidia rufa TaxID=165716 RepID=A0A7J0DYD5_9ERIC|nr:ARM-repeat/Tetratricopeptide repeat (TPR)-like protein [Actinidia rufa]